MIPLYVSNRKAYVWSVDDIATLRQTYRVCGVLSGTLAQLAQQNVFLGPPLILMDEEVVLLIEDDAAFLIDDPNCHLHPPSARGANWIEHTIQDLPVESSSTTKQPDKQKYVLSEDALAKRLARQRKREAEGPRNEDFHDASKSQPGRVVEVVEAEYRFPMTRKSSTLPRYQSEHTYYTLAAAAKAGIWIYPSTPFQRARCSVFRHLWSQGHFLGTGIKFGGDFLVYPGDPLRYHSHFVATVHFKKDALQPMEIVAHGRLGTGTRKNHLICSVDEKSYEVEYFSIEWAGFG